MTATAAIASQDAGRTISKLLWIGRVLSGLAIAFFVFHGVMKIIQPQGHVPSSLSLAPPVSK